MRATALERQARLERNSSSNRLQLLRNWQPTLRRRTRAATRNCLQLLLHCMQTQLCRRNLRNLHKCSKLCKRRTQAAPSGTRRLRGAAEPSSRITQRLPTRGSICATSWRSGTRNRTSPSIGAQYADCALESTRIKSPAPLRLLSFVHYAVFELSLPSCFLQSRIAAAAALSGHVSRARGSALSRLLATSGARGLALAGGAAQLALAAAGHCAHSAPDHRELQLSDMLRSLTIDRERILVSAAAPVGVHPIPFFALGCDGIRHGSR